MVKLIIKEVKSQVIKFGQGRLAVRIPKINVEDFEPGEIVIIKKIKKVS